MGMEMNKMGTILLRIADHFKFFTLEMTEFENFLWFIHIFWQSYYSYVYVHKEKLPSFK